MRHLKHHASVMFLFFVLVIAIFVITKFIFWPNNISVVNNENLNGSATSTAPDEVETNVSNPPETKPTDTETNTSQKENIKMLYPTKKQGRVWQALWSDRDEIVIKSGKRDPLDSEFIARGNGKITLNGNGIAHMEGSSPRMYVYDSNKEKKWHNVEITVYAKRIEEADFMSAQGIVIGARSEHQDAADDDERMCYGKTYYGRILYDGRANFQKELVHHEIYSRNKPSEDNIIAWGTTNGEFPRYKWIGMKFIVMNNPDKKSVKLELYMDTTEGRNGGDWKKVAEYTDSGDWAVLGDEEMVLEKCGFPSNMVLTEPGTSVFLRNDDVEDVEYKWFSIREIEI